MKTSHTLAGLNCLFLTMASGASNSAHTPPRLSEPATTQPVVHQSPRLDWLARDDIGGGTVNCLMTQGAREARQLFASLGKCFISADRPIGYGGRRIILLMSSGTRQVTVVLFRDRIAQFQVLADSQPSLYTELSRMNSWDFVIHKRGHNVVCTFLDETVLTQCAEAVAEALGAPVEVAVPSEFQHAYELLTSPLWTLDVGLDCYFPPQKPEGRRAIEKLVRNDQWTLIANVLRGLDPEGRIYAAQVMLEEAKKGHGITADDRAIIRTLRHLPIEVSTCSGCTVEPQTGVDILPPMNQVNRYED